MFQVPKIELLVEILVLYTQVLVSIVLCLDAKSEWDLLNA